MHILILEAGLTGHHANYLEHIAATFLEQGHRLTISVREGHLNNPLFARLQADGTGQVAVKPLPSPPAWTNLLGRLGVVGSELSHWLMFKKFFEQLSAKDQVDHVFLPYLDYCLHATALLGPPCGQVKWSGICMRPSFHYSDAGVIAPKPKWSAIKERLFYRLLQQPGLQRLLTIDELLEQETKKKCPRNAHKLGFVPDPAELTSNFDQASARSLLGISEKDFVILVYGVIDDRKGVENLLAGVRNKPFPKNVKILAMGRHTPELREKLSNEPQVISINQYVDTPTEEAGFRAADVVWIGYRAHYAMSGVLVLAAFARKPVIATRNGLIGWIAQRYHLGPVLDCEDAQDVSKALQLMMHDNNRKMYMRKSDSICLRHSWSVFSAAITANLENKHRKGK